MKSLQYSFQLKVGKSDGFTLLESMIAMFVFTFGVMAVFSMTANSMSNFSRSRSTSVEVNRTASNLEVLKDAGYNNSNIFQGSEIPAPGNDGAMVVYTDMDNAVIFETKLIVMQNNKIKGSGAGGNYEVYYIKPLIE